MNTTTFTLTHLKADQYLMQETGRDSVKIRADKSGISTDDDRSRALYYSCSSLWGCTDETCSRNLSAVRKAGSKTFKADLTNAENLLEMWSKARAWQERLLTEEVDIELSGQDYVVLDPCYIESKIDIQPAAGDATCYEEHRIAGGWAWRTVEGDGRYTASIGGSITDLISVDSGTMAIIPMEEIEEMDVDYSGHMALAKGATHLHIGQQVVTITTAMGNIKIEMY